MSGEKTKTNQARENGKTFVDEVLSYGAFALDMAACMYLFFATVMIPLYNRWDYLHIGSDKIAFLWKGCKFSFGVFLFLWAVWLLLSLAKGCRERGFSFSKLKKNLRRGFSVTDWFVLGYGCSVFLSYLASDYRELAFLGKSTWGMGMLVQEVFVLSYFSISRMWKRRSWLIGLTLPASAILFVLGIFNRFGIYPIPMKTATSPQFISLAGNINWYCGYMVMPILACAGFVWSYKSDKRWPRWILDVYLVLAFCALVTNGSASGLVALSGVFFVLLLLSMGEAKRLMEFGRLCLLLSAACLFVMAVRLFFPEAINYRDSLMDLFTFSVLPPLLAAGAALVWLLARNWEKKGNYPTQTLRTLGKALAWGAAAVGVLFVGMIVLNTLRPGSLGPLSQIPALTFSAKWGSRRGATWKIGVWLWGDLSPWKKLVGVGPDCMGEYLLTDASQEMKEYLRGVWPNKNLTNAHCELLTVLDQIGLLGAISFGGLLCTAIYRYIRRLEWGASVPCFVSACGLGLLAYALNGIFSFQQVLNGPFMFALLGVGEAYCRALPEGCENGPGKEKAGIEASGRAGTAVCGKSSRKNN